MGAELEMEMEMGRGPRREGGGEGRVGREGLEGFVSSADDSEFFPRGHIPVSSRCGLSHATSFAFLLLTVLPPELDTFA